MISVIKISFPGDCILCEQDSRSTHCGWGRASGVVGDDDGYCYNDYEPHIDSNDDDNDDVNYDDSNDDDNGTGGSVEDPATSRWERTEEEAETSMRFSSSSISSSFPSEIANVWRFSSMLYPILFLSSSKLLKFLHFSGTSWRIRRWRWWMQWGWRGRWIYWRKVSEKPL